MPLDFSACWAGLLKTGFMYEAYRRCGGAPIERIPSGDIGEPRVQIALRTPVPNFMQKNVWLSCRKD